MASPSLAQRECMTCTVAVAHPSTCAISAAELPSATRMSTHCTRWNSAIPLACLSLAVSASIVASSLAIRSFIAGSC